MYIVGATLDDINNALAKTNEQYNNNICYNHFPELVCTTREGKPKYRLTLRVKNSKGEGARRGYTGRRLISACWHVHGTFFDNLPPTTTIITAGGTTHPGTEWQDRNIGSILHPLFFSEACDC